MRTSFAIPNLQLSLPRKRKAGGIAGLDIEAGSIAATEVVGTNGTSRVTASAIQALEPGAFHEGEVLDSDRLATALKRLFAEHKLSKQVRLGIGNQRVVVRTLRLPAIEDPAEMEAAVRFQAQEQMPMPLDQAVIEHQVVGGVPAEEGAAPQVDVVVVAARRDMVSSFIEPIRRAGLEPVGVDLSAFAMIRALADAGAADASVEPGQRPGEAVLYCNVGDVTNLAVARGRSCLFTRVSYAGLESISERLASTAGSAPSTRRSGSPSSASSAPSRKWKATRRSSPSPARRWRRASPPCSTSCASRSTTTAPRRAPYRSGGSCSAAPAARFRASRRAWRLSSARRSPSRGRPGWRGSKTRRRRA